MFSSHSCTETGPKIKLQMEKPDPQHQCFTSFFPVFQAATQVDLCMSWFHSSELVNMWLLNTHKEMHFNATNKVKQSE